MPNPYDRKKRKRKPTGWEEIREMHGDDYPEAPERVRRGRGDQYRKPRSRPNTTGAK